MLFWVMQVNLDFLLKKYRVSDIDNSFLSSVYYTDRTVSTMEDAELLARDGVCHGVALFAGFQSSGRGRIASRSWRADVGSSLLTTVILDPKRVPFAVEKTPLAVGAAIALMLRDSFGVDATLSWPNDVLVGGKKISGVLCEFKRGALLCGVGINGLQVSFDGEYRREPVSLFQVTGERASAGELLSLFLGSLFKLLDGFDWLPFLSERLEGVGEVVRFLPGDPEVSSPIVGKLLGLDSRGGVKIEIDNGSFVSYLSGEFLP